MRSKSLLGILACSGLFVLAGSVGCSDDGTQTTTGTGGSGTSSSSSSSSSTAASSSTSSGFVADDNKDCDSAVSIVLGEPALADVLDVAEGDKDYFVFEGNLGDAVGILTDSKPDVDEFDPTYPDLVITLKMKDANGAWVDIAQNDDPYPMPRTTNDSAMYTKLPETGTFCVEVTECNTLFPGQCSPVADILLGDYTILAGTLHEAAMGIQGEMSTEPSDTAGTIEYENVQMGTLFRDLGWGTFADDKDVDMWAYTAPANVKVEPGARAACHFEFFYPGVQGNGSTAEKNILAYVVEAANPQTIIAQIDPTIYDTTAGPPEPMTIGAPCEPGKDYLFVMSRSMGAMAGKNDFYYFNHYILSGNPVEGGMNDNIAMPEVLTPSDNVMEGASYFVDGDIDKSGDVDYYSVDVPAMSTQLSIACGSERGGSSLRGFKVTPLGANDMPLAAGKGNLLESATKSLFSYEIPIPSGVTTVKLKVEATLASAPNITSTYYRCGFHVRPPAAP
jgi:hypothetical protein